MAGELVLITGVSSFVGFAVTLSTLEAGYRIRAVVRRESQIEELKQELPRQGQVEFVVVPNLGAAGAFDDKLESVDYIIHVASPVTTDTGNVKQDLLEPARDITLSLLTAAVKYPQIKRLVVTSSLSVYVPYSEFVTGKFSRDVFRSDDEICHYSVNDKFPIGLFNYAAGKSIAIDTAEMFLKSNNPSFETVFLFPSFIFGPNKLSKTVEHFNKGSNSILLNHILGKSKNPLVTVSVHIDDVAKAHVLALQPSVPAGRYLLDSEGPTATNWSDAMPIVKKYYAEAVPSVFAEDAKPFEIKMVLDNAKAEKAFGIKFKSFEQQVKDTAGFYLSLLPN
ncbi:hypothetical protein F5B22DRAFT_648925 [Xylaria bambusicola]|uniref:uncharacterized protein n=1 Tax=Xylaria bambusicola TaxID=326684 RepID=UPI002008BCB3|nr:uncharacterized protein F5B22DRAFT_648925 [Xylaria bambusicola]KAI0509500.1 hypothetical protein F5B22DRAFT_648925 [Xylaria bambusicola]